MVMTTPQFTLSSFSDAIYLATCHDRMPDDPNSPNPMTRMTPFFRTPVFYIYVIVQFASLLSSLRIAPFGTPMELLANLV